MNGLFLLAIGAAIQSPAVSPPVSGRFGITKSLAANSCPAVPTLRNHPITVVRAGDSVIVDDGNGRFVGRIASDGSFRTAMRSGELADGTRLTAALSGTFTPGAFQATLHAERFAADAAEATCRYDIRWSGSPLDDPPGAAIVGPTTISTGSVYRGSFTPDGDTIYYFRRTGAGEDYRIFRAWRSGTDWSPPQRVELAGDYSDTYPALSDDGSQMVFASYRPAPDTSRFPPQAYLWIVHRDGAEWGTPRFLQETNRPARYHSQPRIMPDGSLEFVVQTPDYRQKTMLTAPASPSGFGRADTSALWRAWQSRTIAGQHLYDVTRAPDGSYVILALGSRPDPAARPGPADLWIARWTTDGWSAPQPLDGGVNTAGIENFPFWAPDGRELYFVRDFSKLYRIAAPGAAPPPG